MPLPGVAPIIVAARPIADNLKANELLVVGKKVLFGLLSENPK